MRFARQRNGSVGLRTLGPFLLLAATFALATQAGAQAGAWQVGSPAPDLRLPTIDGDTLSLADLRGEKLLLFEFASW